LVPVKETKMADDKIRKHDLTGGQGGGGPAVGEQDIAVPETPAEVGAAAAPAPVENFDLITGNLEGRMFQNGDTDPGDGRSN
jgi:hypothetical protein